MNLKAAVMTCVVLFTLCGLALAETLSVAKTEAKYGIHFKAEGDEITFESGDTLKAVVTDPAKLENCMKKSFPEKGADILLVYKGEGNFTMLWRDPGKVGRFHVGASIIEM
jgi:hypothetical protein